MRVLVAAASKHGSTQEIAAAIAEGLRGRGVEAEALEAGEVRALDGYEAVVLGSAVYAGHWMKPMLELVEGHADALRALPAWLFSSGPLGAPDPKPSEEPVDVATVTEAIGPEDHRVFAGRLDRSKLGFAERALVKALHAPYGDFRDWEAIDAYAGEIAEKLVGRATPAGAGT